MADPDRQVSATSPKRAVEVADVAVGVTDFAGDIIRCVYSYNPPRYAIYRTATRVMVHYSDQEREALEQRRRLACLTPLRGQISGLIDGWHSAKAWFRKRLGARSGGDGEADPQPAMHRLRKRANRYDRRTADALALAIEGDVQTAMSLLAEVKNDIIGERTSIARIWYFLTALMIGTVIAIVALAFTGFSVTAAHAPAIATAVAGGTVGAMFSIAVGLRGRTVLIDLQNRMNIFDAILRMLIGAIAGGLFLCLLLSRVLENVIQVEQLHAVDNEKYNPLLVFIIGFLGGFFERLVPDLLNQTNLGTEEGRGTVAGTAATNTPGGTRATAGANAADEGKQTAETGAAETGTGAGPPSANAG